MQFAVENNSANIIIRRQQEPAVSIGPQFENHVMTLGQYYYDQLPVNFAIIHYCNHITQIIDESARL
jgi:hypothetical protein